MENQLVSFEVNGYECTVNNSECVGEIINKIESFEDSTKIPINAFKNCKELVKITIPPGVNEICLIAFSGCRNLQKIIIPNSVTRIGEFAFSYCSSLTSITIPSSVTSIGNCAFSGCSSLKTITIPSSASGINLYEGFSGCNMLTKIIIPIPSEPTGYDYINFYSLISRLERRDFIYLKIDENNIIPFKNAAKQITANIPDNTAKFISNVSIACNDFTKFTIPGDVTSIGDGAFSDCSSLTTITIPSSVTSIGNFAFSYCSSLRQITIPSSVTSIGNCAFSDCSSLTSITIPSSVTSIGRGLFSYCTDLTSIEIPDALKTMIDFEDCRKLTMIAILPNEIEDIMPQMEDMPKNMLNEH